MYIHYDPDLYETVVDSRPCTACNGDRSRCFGQCNGSSGISQRLRAPADVAKIKAERQRAEEDAILAQAEMIKLQRGITP